MAETGITGEASLAAALGKAMKEGLESTRSTSTRWRTLYDQCLTLDFIAHGTYGDSEDQVSANSREAFIERTARFLEANPDYQMHVTSDSSTVLMQMQPPQATTFCTVELTGLAGTASEADTIAREAVIVFSWRLERDGIWRIWHHSTMRGPGAMKGF